MDKKSANKLHCHFFHTTNSCKKGDACGFLHGTKLKGCPNGERCPIQILHMEIEDDKKPFQKKFGKETPKKNEDKANETKIEENSSSDEKKPQMKKAPPKVPSELEDEEKKESHVKPPPKPAVIKENLPDYIKTFIQSYYHENQEAANFISNFYLIQQDMHSFLPIYQSMLPRMELDLMFIVDCTGSMSSWIQAVKTEITSIIAAIKDQNKGNTVIRISFVGYRDYGDSNRFSIFEFSDEMDLFETFLLKVNASGGNDTPEDVAGGFKHANLQNWKSPAKYAVLLADAPAHGKDFCDIHGDRYPEGDPDGVDLKEEFKKLIKKGVKLYAVEITGETKKMFDLFKNYNKEECGQDLDIPKLGHSTQGFGQFISQTASQTLSMSYTKGTKEDPQGAFYKALKICQGQNTVSGNELMKRFNLKEDHDSDESEEEKKSDYNVVNYKVSPAKEFPYTFFSQNIDAICHSYFIVQDPGVPINWKKPLVQHSQLKTRIQISRVPFAEGAMRFAFFAKDTLLNQKLVAKLNKKQHKTDPVLDKEDMIKDLESQFICQHIVNQFNDRVSIHVQQTENLKNFVHCFIYEFMDSGHPHKFYAAENYIPGEYVKFNNNAGWCNFKFDEPGLLSQALSHFSYQITEGYLMIVDLQGVGGLLTDPQIHCLDRNRFGSGNLGYQGMFKFFMSHQCNQFCKHLNLIHPSIKEIPNDLKFYNEELEKPSNPHQKVCTMCDVCRKSFKINAGFLYERRIQCREKYCPPCNSMRVATMKTDYCKICNGPFHYSTYWTLMKRTSASELCMDCRKEERDRLRNALNSE